MGSVHEVITDMPRQKICTGKDRIVSNEDGEDEDGDLAKLTCSENFMKKLAIVTTFITNWDVFSIYKGNYKHSSKSRYKLYLGPELKMQTGSVDKWRQRLFALICVLYVPLTLRSTMICLVQWAKYRATSFTSMGKPIVTDTRLIKILKQLKLYHTFDNVLSDLPRMTLIIHLILIISLSYIAIYIPYYYHSIKPLDMIDLRIGLNLRQERKRIDLLLGAKVKSLMLAIRANSARSCLRARCHRYFVLNKIDGRIQGVVNVLQAEQTIQSGHDELAALRSARFDANYPKILFRQDRQFLAIVTLISGFFGFMLETDIIKMVVGLKCELRLNERAGSSSCSMGNVLTAYEIYDLMELLLRMNWLGYILSGAALTILVILDAQKLIMNELKSDLNDLLGALRLISESRIQDKAKREQAKMVVEKEPYLNDALLKILVKTQVSLDEFKAQNILISEQVSSFIVFFGAAILLNLTLGQLITGPDMEKLRRDAGKYLWIVANSMLVVCAFMYAKIVKLQAIGYSILAQLQLISISSAGASGNQVKPDKILTAAWRKFIEADSFVDGRNSIRPYGMSLTFNQIMEMNFYVTSLAALLFR